VGLHPAFFLDRVQAKQRMNGSTSEGLGVQPS
jgi:hypothetical protein